MKSLLLSPAAQSPPCCHSCPLHNICTQNGGKPVPSAGRKAGAAVGDAVQAAAAEATAQAATVFLAQGGEEQADAVPPHVAEATAARSGSRKED